MTTLKQITITEEQIEMLLAIHKNAERRLERAIETDNPNQRAYICECVSIEQVLDVIGISTMDTARITDFEPE